jgi:predicted ester cyclase
VQAGPNVGLQEDMRMSKQKDQVRKFYDVLWNARNLNEIPSVLHEHFTFRGSLGQERRGHEGFAEYVNMVHEALEKYQCDINELIEEGDRVFAKMTFSGIHEDLFLGYSPTGKRLWWAGCALFRFDGDKISDLWVLGDLKGLEDQLKVDATQQGDAADGLTAAADF